MSQAPLTGRTVRYCFGPFTLSPRQRALWRAEREVALIPRYFDLLVLLVQRRDEAVHRADIFSTVWGDVVVSDGALTQAVRALRRALGDDPREPSYIRTVSRHGYRFVHAGVREEPEESMPVGAARPASGLPTGGSTDAEPRASTRAPSVATTSGPPHGDAPHQSSSASPFQPRDARRGVRGGFESPAEPPGTAADGTRGDPLDGEFESAFAQLTSPSSTDEERREAAERLHAAGTAGAVQRLAPGPGMARARAMLRDARWDVAGAGRVPLFGPGGGVAAIAALVLLRVRRAWRLAGDRWLSSALGAALAGVVAGAAGGFGLWLGPGAQAPPTAAAVLAVVGALAGAAGAAGVGGGLSATEAVARSRRGPWLALGGAAGGLAAGTVAHWLTRWTLEGLFGLSPGPFGGSLEGLVLGLAAGAGYAWATADVTEGMAAPRGLARWHAALRVAGCCAAAAVLLGAAGRPMVGGLVNAIAQASRSSHLALTPLAQVVGEPEFGVVTAAVLGALEGAAFGCGLTLGLTRRPRFHA